jgi:hypothetical protein
MNSPGGHRAHKFGTMHTDIIQGRRPQALPHQVINMTMACYTVPIQESPAALIEKQTLRPLMKKCINIH